MQIFTVFADRAVRDGSRTGLGGGALLSFSYDRFLSAIACYRKYWHLGSHDPHSLDPPLPAVTQLFCIPRAIFEFHDALRSFQETDVAREGAGRAL